MTTSMNTAEAAAKAERVKRTKVILAVLLGLVPLATMFLPYVRYAFPGCTTISPPSNCSPFPG